MAGSDVRYFFNFKFEFGIMPQPIVGLQLLVLKHIFVIVELILVFKKRSVLESENQFILKFFQTMGYFELVLSVMGAILKFGIIKLALTHPSLFKL
jgi:hypothetical protein